MGWWDSGKVEKVDACSAGEGALPFGQRVMFAVLRGRQRPLAAEGCGIAIGHASGVRVQRVQRVQRVWYRLTAMSIYAACGGNAAGGSENQTTAPAARWKCTPIPACGGTSPGGGSLLYSQLLNS